MKRSRMVLLSLSLVTLCLALALTLGFVVPFIVKKLQPETTKFTSTLGNYSKAAVVTDARECATVGRIILEVNSGSAVDAAIATLLCMGVVIPHSMGLGGGFLMTIYSKETDSVHVLDARETAPQKAHKDMYLHNSRNKITGGLSVAIPGELRGYQEAHKKFGRLDWSTLFLPAIRLAEEGFPVGSHLSSAMELMRSRIGPQHSLRKHIVNSKTGKFYRKDEIMKNENLARTLEKISNKSNADDLYTGELAEDIIETITKDGGIMTMADLNNYQPRWLPAIRVSNLTENNLTLLSVPPPGSGVLLALILNVMSLYNPNKNSVDSDPALFYHRLLETYKFAFAERSKLEDRQDSTMEQLLSKMTSQSLAKEIVSYIDDTRTFHDPKYYGAQGNYGMDHGTAQVCVLAPNGDAIAVSSTINIYFGSRLITSSGIILNNEMDDFSSANITNTYRIPPTSTNLIEPGRRPYSSMAPSIVVDADGNVRMVIGGSGGPQILTGIASVIIRSQWLGEDIKTAVDAPRIHQQLFPNTSIYEKNFSPLVLSGLASRCHVLEELRFRGAVVEGIVQDPQDGRVYANADFRKGGAQDGF